MDNIIKDFNEDTRKCKCCGRELPTSDFSRNRFGLVHICKECAKQHRSAGRKKTNEINDILRQLDDAKTMRLESFTPRELMLELKRRGYEGTLTYTETRTVNITNLN